MWNFRRKPRVHTARDERMQHPPALQELPPRGLPCWGPQDHPLQLRGWLRAQGEVLYEDSEGLWEFIPGGPPARTNLPTEGASRWLRRASGSCQLCRPEPVLGRSVQTPSSQSALPLLGSAFRGAETWSSARRASCISQKKTVETARPGRARPRRPPSRAGGRETCKETKQRACQAPTHDTRTFTENKASVEGHRSRLWKPAGRRGGRRPVGSGGVQGPAPSCSVWDATPPHPHSSAAAAGSAPPRATEGPPCDALAPARTGKGLCDSTPQSCGPASPQTRRKHQGLLWRITVHTSFCSTWTTSSPSLCRPQASPPGSLKQKFLK